MAIDLQFVSFIVAVVLFVAIGIGYLFGSTRPKTRRREEIETRRIASQPWDGAGGRANR